MGAEDHKEEEREAARAVLRLVFVFGLTQVTTMLSTDPTWDGLLRGILVLGAIWWAWAAYAWLTNTLNPEEGIVRIAMFGVMAAMLVAALAVPEAFDEHGVIFGVAYLIVRAMHLALYALAARGDHDLLGAVLRFIPSSTISGALILTAASAEGDARIALWVIALAVDYLGALVGRGARWHLSPGHFAERHGLIVITRSASRSSRSASARRGRRSPRESSRRRSSGSPSRQVSGGPYRLGLDRYRAALRQATGTQQTELAWDAYSYLHFLMVAGIVLFAVAMKKTLADYDGHLGGVLATALCGGLALYLLAHVLLRLRISGVIAEARGSFLRRVGRGRHRDAHAPCVLALRGDVPALPAVAFVAAVFVGLIAYEALRYRESRSRIRHGEPITEQLLSRSGAGR